MRAETGSYASPAPSQRSTPSAPRSSRRSWAGSSTASARRASSSRSRSSTAVALLLLVLLGTREVPHGSCSTGRPFVAGLGDPARGLGPARAVAGSAGRAERRSAAPRPTRSTRCSSRWPSSSARCSSALAAALASPQLALLAGAGPRGRRDGGVRRDRRGARLRAGRGARRTTPAGASGRCAAPACARSSLTTLPIGFCLGAAEVAFPAFGESLGDRALAGPLIALWSLGSALGGLLYGAHGHRISAVQAYLRTLARAAARHAPARASVSRSRRWSPLALLAGHRDRAADRRGQPAGRRGRSRGALTEAYTWPLTALVGGVAVGNAASGAIVQRRRLAPGVHRRRGRRGARDRDRAAAPFDAAHAVRRTRLRRRQRQRPPAFAHSSRCSDAAEAVRDAVLAAVAHEQDLAVPERAAALRAGGLEAVAQLADVDRARRPVCAPHRPRDDVLEPAEDRAPLAARARTRESRRPGSHRDSPHQLHCSRSTARA